MCVFTVSIVCRCYCKLCKHELQVRIYERQDLCYDVKYACMILTLAVTMLTATYLRCGSKIIKKCLMILFCR